MKTKQIMLFGALCAALTLSSYCCRQTQSIAEVEETIVMQDFGAEPTVLNIEDYTLANENFRAVIWTGNLLQVTVMSIPVGGDVGLEQHPETDQFLRIERGTGRVMMGESMDNLDFVRDVSGNDAIFVPAGKWHNIVNKGDTPLKIYSIYAPVEHPHGTIHKTQQDDIH